MLETKSKYYRKMGQMCKILKHTNNIKIKHKTQR